MNNEIVTISRAEYERLLKANKELTKRVEILTQQIALARRQRFGPSSEQSKYDDGSETTQLLVQQGRGVQILRNSPHLVELPAADQFFS